MKGDATFLARLVRNWYNAGFIPLFYIYGFISILIIEFLATTRMQQPVFHLGNHPCNGRNYFSTLHHRQLIAYFLHNEHTLFALNQ
jgi:hypothetical protein